eukprot:Lankesteria_metandrocarpae@DN5272_c1_g1_i4.p1
MVKMPPLFSVLIVFLIFVSLVTFSDSHVHIKNPKKKRHQKKKVKKTKGEFSENAMRRVETRSGRNSRFTKTSQLQKVSYLDATPDMFAGFDPPEAAERNSNKYPEFEGFFKSVNKNINEFCEALEVERVFTCIRARDGVSWNYRGDDVRYHVSFGRNGIAAIVNPQLGITVLRDCEAFPDFRLESCKNLKFTTERIKGRYYVAKSPISEASWELHHLLGRCKFWHRDDPKQRYRPFPVVIDLPGERGIAVEKKTKTLMFEYFTGSVAFSRFHEIMRGEYPGMDAVIDLYALRYVYIYAFWAAVFARFSFEHRDFHSNNVMVDLTQVRSNFGELNRIGLNHIYAIDLDTFKYPSSMEKLHPGLQATLDRESNQGRRPDSVCIGFVIELCFEEAKDDAAMADWLGKIPGLCFEVDQPLVCSRGEQIKALDFALNYLWNYNIKYNKNALSELYPPSEVKKFDCGC